MPHQPPPSEDEFPRVVTLDELRFDVSFALGQMPRSLWWTWILGKELYQEHTREQIVNRIVARFERYQVRAPAPLPAHCLNAISGKEFHAPPSTLDQVIKDSDVPY